MTVDLRLTEIRASSVRFRLFLAVLLLFTVAANAQKYTSVVVFGDSLSDVGNVADLTQVKYGVRIPGPVGDYTDGRFTDGFDTAPAARNYRGVWVEQFAAMLPAHLVLRPSLEGGTDYAYGFATTGGGTAPLTFGPGNALSVTVSNIGQQISTYLGTHPKISDKTLFVVWGGAIDLLYAKSADDVVQAAINQAGNVQRLIQAGATQFLVPNLPPLGAVPRLNGSPTTSIPATAASVLFNDTLRLSLGIVRDLNFYRRPQITELDVFGLFTRVIASPSTYQLFNVTDKSQGLLSVNPDTYLFWDDLHPTTHGHYLLAATAMQMYAKPQASVGASEAQ